MLKFCYNLYDNSSTLEIRRKGIFLSCVQSGKGRGETSQSRDTHYRQQSAELETAVCEGTTDFTCLISWPDKLLNHSLQITEYYRFIQSGNSNILYTQVLITLLLHSCNGAGNYELYLLLEHNIPLLKFVLPSLNLIPKCKWFLLQVDVKHVVIFKNTFICLNWQN